MSHSSVRILLLVVAWFVSAAAEPSPVRAGIEARDLFALEGLSHSAATADEKRLADGAALALRHKDDAAVAILKNLSGADKDIHAGACMALSDVYLRQGRFAEARAALECVQEFSGKMLTGEAAQTLHWSEVLEHEKPMQLAQPAAGKLDAWRDSAGLIRVSVTINGKAQDAVIDTDASLSVLSESKAAALGVRVLEKQVTILTSTRPDLPMHLGIADELRFGDAVFSNVVFAVLPDSAVRFSQNYKMNVVVGLPVLVALDRIEYAKDGGWGSLSYGPKPGVASPANMALSGLDPFVLVKAGGAQLRLAIDTAATNTTLNATALKDFPALGDGASRGWVYWEGGGGAATDTKARTLYRLDLAVAERPFTLRGVKILSSEERDRHGMIGQDLLKQGKRWVIDFSAMRFTIDD